MRPRTRIPPDPEEITQVQTPPEEVLISEPTITETTEKQNDMPLPIIGILSAGAGLLAKGVSGLFSGEGKARRQARRAERKAGREERREERQAAAFEDVEQIVSGRMGPPPPSGDVAAGGYEAAPPSRRPRGDAGDFISKNWMWIAAAALLLFGGKLLKPARRAPRRRPKPKTVIRYRTRKPATRKR